MESVVYAGAAGWAAADSGKVTQGFFRLDAGSGSWSPIGGGLPASPEVRCIAIAPQDPRTVYAGTHDGPYRSRDAGATWERLALPADDRTTWSILLHPSDPDVLYVGTQDFGIYRTRDGGESWDALPVPETAGICHMGFPSRVIDMALDPANPREIYAGIEVGGVVRSLDGGDSWEDCSRHLLELAGQPHLKSRIGSDTDTEGMMDSHALVVSAARPGTVFLACRMGLFRSDDRGMRWTEMGIGRHSPLTYARDLVVSPHDPKTLYAALSVAAVSDAGSLYRSTDFGESWTRVDRDVSIDSTLMTVGLSGASPDRVFCAARRGQVFGTEDGGRSWREYKLPDGVQGVYAVACA